MKSLFTQILIIFCNFILINSQCLTDCCKTLAERPPLVYTFYQNTGHFIGGIGKWEINTYGYSGAGEGLLNPAYQCVMDEGPLPQGNYTLAWCKDVMHTTTIRPCSFYLAPNDQSTQCGRSNFFIHGCQCCTQGDTTTPPTGGCSLGCVVINIENRQKLRIGDTLVVKPYEDQQTNQNQEAKIEIIEQIKKEDQKFLSLVE